MSGLNFIINSLNIKLTSFFEMIIEANVYVNGVLNSKIADSDVTIQF